MFLSPWHLILAIYFSWDYGRSLVLSDLPNIPRLISLHYVPTPLLFPFNNCTWKLFIQTHYITFQDINLQPYFKTACVKSLLWPVLNSNAVDVSLSGGSLGYWTACNNFKGHCKLPYCAYDGSTSGNHSVSLYTRNRAPKWRQMAPSWSDLSPCLFSWWRHQMETFSA